MTNYNEVTQKLLEAARIAEELEVVKIITKEEAREIIEERLPMRRFIFKDSDKYVGIDNTTGDAWVEEFSEQEDCVRWLKGEFEIEEITREEALKTVKDRRPFGLFIVRDNGMYLGIDNAVGDVLVGEFKCREDCIDWLIEEGKTEDFDEQEIPVKEERIIDSLRAIEKAKMYLENDCLDSSMPISLEEEEVAQMIIEALVGHSIIRAKKLLEFCGVAIITKEV